MSQTADELYPHVARWVKDHGWIEIGYDDYQHSILRALDIGGMIWEGAASYPTLEDALQALDQGVAQWMREGLGEDT